MAVPTLVIGGHDYAQYVPADGGITLAVYQMDADGSGRDIHTGLMYRSRVATKRKLEIKTMKIPSSVAAALAADLDVTYLSATILDPISNTHVERTYYCSSVTFGNQVLDPASGVTYYDEVKFDLIER